jgi:glyoxylase-like metal-dependent hydrolase (beta-lactamase superfamily II)
MKVTPIVASTFRTDGGTMFGMVPKSIWSTLAPPDQDNTISQYANCLVVELPDGRLGLIDTGYGDPSSYSQKLRTITHMGPLWDLMDALAVLGLQPSQFDFVIFTHLHLDHAGGAGVVDPNGDVRLTFPNAKHFVHQWEWRAATADDPLLGDAYPDRAVSALRNVETEQLLLVTDAAPDILPGVRMARTGGHTEGHCAIVLTDDLIEIHHPDAETLQRFTTVVFAGDVCPTQGHLRPVYQTAFDVYPLTTRQWKQEFLPDIATEGYLLLYCHDPTCFGSTLRLNESRRPVPDQILRMHYQGRECDESTLP